MVRSVVLVYRQKDGVIETSLGNWSIPIGPASQLDV